MRWKALLVVAGLIGVPALGADGGPESVVVRDRTAAADLVRAAHARSVAALYDQVSELSLTPNLTVGQYLKRLDIRDEFMKTLARADQLGAPRWVDEYTCQVQLQIATARIVNTLQQLAAAHIRASAVTPVQIDLAARGWPQTFTTTGSAASAVALAECKPRVSAAWSGVSDAARQKALQDANANATKAAMESVSPILLYDHKTLGDSFAIPEVGEAVRSWLSHRPVTRVDFKDDLQVEVALAADQQDFLAVIRTALARQTVVGLPREAEEWQRVEREFSASYRPPVGLAKVGAAGAAVSRQVTVPERAPEWANEQIEVQGSATGQGPKLRTARQAEADAMSKLKTRIDELALTKEMTVGEAARKDLRVLEAVQLTMRRARIVKTQYNPDGTVVVNLSADLRGLWEELRR